MSKSITIRIQSSEGTKRLEIKSNDTKMQLYQKVAESFSLSSIEDFTLYKEKNKRLLIERSKGPVLLNHGDMIFLVGERPDLFPNGNYGSPALNLGLPAEKALTSGSYSSPKFGSVPSNSSFKNFPILEPREDEVDVQLDKVDGRIPRPRDPHLCHHNAHGKCLHCIPIEPFDEGYLKNRNPPIKHMSFHAFIKKLQSSTAGERTTFANLENLSCSIKDKCSTGHAPWPKGICTKCQPNSVTLMRQPYRHVDNIMFENGNLVNRFLNYWRSCGHQRIGYLYGRYEMYDAVPLGIRAVVTAIYEPPQETSRDSVKLTLPDPQEDVIEQIAQRLNMVRVGWIFTDLIPDETRSGKGPVIHHRGNMNSYFLSAQECITAAWFQNNNPNICKYSPDGYFGSKFVTVVVTGDAEGQIHFEGYQVSNQCMALVKSKILLPTYDAPELGYIRETSSEKYVPDVFYKEKDSYNNEVMKIARPLPLEYLIIDVPTGFPSDDAQRKSSFNDDCSSVKTPFPIENRTQIGELQDMNALSTYLKQFNVNRGNSATTFTAPQFKPTDILSDLHLLRFLAINEIFPFSKDQMDPLLDSIRTNNVRGVEAWTETGEWQTIVQALQTQTPMSTDSINRPNFMDYDDATDFQRAMAQWNCPRCTFINSAGSKTCEMCSYTQGS